MRQHVEAFLAHNGLSQLEVAAALGLHKSGVCRRVAGATPWKDHEISRLLDYATTKLGRRVTFEEVGFGSSCLTSSEL